MLMGVERIEAIAREMMAHGVRSDLPVALIRWATTGPAGNARRNAAEHRAASARDRISPRRRLRFSAKSWRCARN